MVDSVETSEDCKESSAATTLHSLTHCVESLLGAISEGVNRELQFRSLTPMDFAMLNQFSASGEWTATELARVLPVEVSAISRMVAKMVDNGLMSRRRSRRDRRVVFLKLTDAGNALADEIQRSVLAYEDRLTEGICELEIETFYSVISKILSNYDSLPNS